MFRINCVGQYSLDIGNVLNFILDKVRWYNQMLVFI